MGNEPFHKWYWRKLLPLMGNGLIGAAAIFLAPWWRPASLMLLIPGILGLGCVIARAFHAGYFAADEIADGERP